MSKERKQSTEAKVAKPSTKRRDARLLRAETPRAKQPARAPIEREKTDISTLEKTGHLYFAPTFGE
jgi:hypothetical protein